MPYTNPKKRANRDSQRNAQRRQDNKIRRSALGIENRFSTWLDGILRSEEIEDLESEETFATAAPTMLAEHLGVQRSYISKLRRGTSPGIEMTFKIGVALRECGLSWSSGLFALSMRGFAAEELALLDTLERRHEVRREALVDYIEQSHALRTSAITDTSAIKRKLSHAVAHFSKYEKLAYREWSSARNRSFGLLGAAYYLVQSGLDPVDISDACGALVQRWATRSQPRQNLVAALSDLKKGSNQ